LFDGLENPFEATRYHSLVLDPPTIPDCLTVIATATDDATIMAVAHAAYPVYGVQFHPESILTVSGKQLLRNFLSLAGVSCH
jgi:anthranilate/para-aminobenzoate synthase component II